MSTVNKNKKKYALQTRPLSHLKKKITQMLPLKHSENLKQN
jgi:hypothetical protein